MINKEEFEKASFEENQKFIKEILRLATHNSFTKDDLLFLIKWQNAIIEQMKNCYNCSNFCDRNVDCSSICVRNNPTCLNLKDYWKMKDIY